MNRRPLSQPSQFPLPAQELLTLLEQTILLREIVLRLRSHQSATSPLSQYRFGEEFFSLFPIVFADRRSAEPPWLITNHYPLSVQLARCKSLPATHTKHLLSHDGSPPTFQFCPIFLSEKRVVYYYNNLSIALGHWLGWESRQRASSAHNKVFFLLSDCSSAEADTVTALETIARYDIPAVALYLTSTPSNRQSSTPRLPLQSLAQRLGFSAVTVEKPPFPALLQTLCHHLDAALNSRHPYFIEMATPSIQSPTLDSNVERQLASDSLVQYQNFLKGLSLLADDRIRRMTEEGIRKAAQLLTPPLP